MTPQDSPRRPVIILGVTADVSLALMRGFPQFLVSQDWEVHIVSSPGPGLHELSSTPGITTHAIQMNREPAPFTDFRALVEWIKLLRHVRPDVISVGTPKAGLLGSIASWLTRVPHRVYLLRGLRLETTRGTRRRVLLALERLSARLSHDVLAVSPSLAQLALENRIGRTRNMHVLGSGSSNGVDVDYFSRSAVADSEALSLAESLGIDRTVPVIGFVGRLTRDKGLTTLAAARKLLADRQVDHQLLVVGDLESRDDASIVTAMVSAGRPAVTTGHVKSTRDYYKLIDVLCLPTLREGFPNVVLEAAAMHVPAITTDATGATDAVIDGETGRRVPVSDPQRLADAIAEMVGDADLRARLGTGAYERAHAEFRQQDVWSRLNQFYRDRLASEFA